MTPTLRPAETPHDYLALQQAQRLAWGLADDSYVVPVATLVGAQHHGGLVLGAFLPDGSAVAVSFAFLGRSGDVPCLYSQLTGVVPGYQGLGIGGQIKDLQRDHARSLGLPLIAWTFDPLQAGNARFNLHRLGASAVRYLPDMYGPRTDALNRGVPTDRLVAEWPVDPAPRRAVDPHDLSRAARLLIGPDEPVTLPMTGAPAALIEIPGAIARLRVDEPARADRWRAAVSRAFLDAFAAGYRAEDFAEVDGRPCYVLRRPIEPRGVSSTT